MKMLILLCLFFVLSGCSVITYAYEYEPVDFWRGIISSEIKHVKWRMTFKEIQGIEKEKNRLKKHSIDELVYQRMDKKNINKVRIDYQFSTINDRRVLVGITYRFGFYPHPYNDKFYADKKRFIKIMCEFIKSKNAKYDSSNTDWIYGNTIFFFGSSEKNKYGCYGGKHSVFFVCFYDKEWRFKDRKESDEYLRETIPNYKSSVVK